MAAQGVRSRRSRVGLCTVWIEEIERDRERETAPFLRERERERERVSFREMQAGELPRRVSGVLALARRLHDRRRAVRASAAFRAKGRTGVSLAALCSRRAVSFPGILKLKRMFFLLLSFGRG